MGIVIMLVKVFVVGRPGSGKTTAVNRILEYTSSKGYATQRFKDYEILYKMFQDDIKREYQNNNERKFRRAEYGGFDVLDTTMFDRALEQLKKEVTKALFSSHEGIATIEFARDDYRYALSKLGSDFLKNAYFLFVNCDLEVCVRRIYERISNPPKPDFHFVSEYIMHSYYSRENWNYMTYHCEKEFPVLEKVVVIENTETPLEEFEKKVKGFAEIILAEVSRKEQLEANLITP